MGVWCESVRLFRKTPLNAGGGEIPGSDEPQYLVRITGKSWYKTFPEIIMKAFRSAARKVFVIV